MLWRKLGMVRGHLVGGPHDGTTRVFPKGDLPDTLPLESGGSSVTYELAGEDGLRVHYRLQPPPR